MPHAASSPPARAELLRRRATTRASLAGTQQPLAQRRLLLRSGIPTGDIGQLVERAQTEQLQELRARAIQHRAELGASALLDQTALQQRCGRRVGADTTDARDLRSGDRLQISDDRQRLRLRSEE